MHLRQAREADVDPVVAFTSDTWSDRDFDDYVPRVFPEWVAGDDRRRRTFVLDAREADATGAPAPDDVAGIVRGELLTDHEGWVQGLRVNPAYRGRGCGARLLEAALEFTREAGASVARCMIFSWNSPSLGLCRSVGFDPVTEFRWAFPDPDRARDDEPAAPSDVSLDGDLTVSEDPDAAWAFWTASAARSHLEGLALDGEKAWALSELTRERVRTAADEGRLFAVVGERTRGTTLRVRTFERSTAPDGAAETWAEYAVGAWRDPEAARALLRVAAADAAAVGADRARMLLPETARWVSDAAMARAQLAEEPDFVLAADLSGGYSVRGSSSNDSTR